MRCGVADICLISREVERSGLRTVGITGAGGEPIVLEAFEGRLLVTAVLSDRHRQRQIVSIDAGIVPAQRIFILQLEAFPVIQSRLAVPNPTGAVIARAPLPVLQYPERSEVVDDPIGPDIRRLQGV